jgi:arginase family enzyme
VPAAVTTFMGVPTASATAGGVTILGAPFDCGPSVHRFGPHLGPSAIRSASTPLLSARIDSDRDPLREFEVRDGGDVDVALDDPAGSLAAIEEAVSGILARGAIPLVLGGDGSIALPAMRALSSHIGEFAVVHMDAHTDCNPPRPGGEAASAFWLADTEGLVVTAASVHIGLRGPALTANSAQLCRGLGYHTIGMDEIVDTGIAATLDAIRRIVGDYPVYLCWDMDVFDPSVAPGVFSPSWGGISAAAGLRLVRGLSGMRIVGADINTVSPPHDIGDLTASLAAQLAFELLFSLPPPLSAE